MWKNGRGKTERGYTQLELNRVDDDAGHDEDNAQNLFFRQSFFKKDVA